MHPHPMENASEYVVTVTTTSKGSSGVPSMIKIFAASQTLSRSENDSGQAYRLIHRYTTHSPRNYRLVPCSLPKAVSRQIFRPPGTW